jgi:tripartite-type tricarboxylate transporter receptor subunit TctC
MKKIVAGILLALAGSFGLTLQAEAQAWPAKPIHFVVAFAPGGPADIVARLVGQKLTEYLGQQIVVENRGGAGGNIGATAVAKSAPDGYTVLVTTTAFAVNVSLFSNPGYDVERDFIPVVAVASQPNLIVVNAHVPAKTLSEYLAQVKGKKIVFASPAAAPRRISPPRICCACWRNSTRPRCIFAARDRRSPRWSRVNRRSGRWPSHRRCRT